MTAGTAQGLVVGVMRALATTLGAVVLAASAARADNLYLRVGGATGTPPLERAFTLTLGRERRFVFTANGTRYRAVVRGRRRTGREILDQGSPANIWSVAIYRGAARRPAQGYSVMDYDDYAANGNCGTSPNLRIDGMDIVLGARRDGPARCEGIVAAVLRR